MNIPNFSDTISIVDKNGNTKKYISEDQLRVFLEHEISKYKDTVDQIFSLCIDAKEKTELIFRSLD
ncbi:MAG: hypothetical protein BWY19_00783 [bacterium ADurb.Bin212]|nr:MAG: hypothetical protein BWY19_00783 [bacterium ADurb.Bin212]